MSLLQYLSQRLLLLGLVVSAGLFYIVYILYQWGVDDSTEYYLEQDMRWAVETLENNQVLPNNTQFRQFYLTESINPPLSPHTLPKKYPKPLISKNDTEYFFLEDNEVFQYGLHQALADGRVLTVVHKFAIEGTVEGLSLLQVSMVSSMILILIMLLGAWFIYQRISVSIQHLLMAAQVKHTHVPTENSIVIDNEFSEIDDVVITLKNALEDLEAKNEQERLFIQTLSHELRTPMATVQVALELLAKKDLSSSVREKIEIISDSNKKMQNLSHDLLFLWSNTLVEYQNEIHESIDLEEELNQVINDLDKAFHCRKLFMVSTHYESSDIVNILASRIHLRLLLNNLCKNAIVHSNSHIHISIQNSQIIISNDKSQSKLDPLVAGSGIGLIIATRAAELLGWEMNVNETTATYQIRVYFAQ